MSAVEIRISNEDDIRCLVEAPAYSNYLQESHIGDSVLVADVGGKIVGAVCIGQAQVSCSLAKSEANGTISSVNADVAKVRGGWISRLFVFPKHRRHGIGTRLVAAAVQVLKNEGHHDAYAGVNVRNPLKEISERVFMRNGFAKIGFCNCSLSTKCSRGVLLKKMLIPVEKENGNKGLSGEIRSLGLSMGAELVGFASTIDLEEHAPDGHKPSNLLPLVQSVVVLACGRKLNEDRYYFYRWGPHFSLTYIRLKEETNQARLQARPCIEGVQNYLKEKGFEAVLEPHGWSGLLSFKRAAYLAGLGVFGRGGFLVHPTLGPLNVLGCVLTNAKLSYDAPLKMDVCGDCTRCVEACKYGAYRRTADGFEWIGEKCRCYDLIMNPVTLKWTYGPCNSKCVHSCPVGK